MRKRVVYTLISVSAVDSRGIVRIYLQSSHQRLLRRRMRVNIRIATTMVTMVMQMASHVVIICVLPTA
jgi:hypothetical protein